MAEARANDASFVPHGARVLEGVWYRTDGRRPTAAESTKIQCPACNKTICWGLIMPSSKTTSKGLLDSCPRVDYASSVASAKRAAFVRGRSAPPSATVEALEVISAQQAEHGVEPQGRAMHGKRRRAPRGSSTPASSGFLKRTRVVERGDCSRSQFQDRSDLSRRTFSREPIPPTQFRHSSRRSRRSGDPDNPV